MTVYGHSGIALAVLATLAVAVAAQPVERAHAESGSSASPRHTMPVPAPRPPRTLAAHAFAALTRPASGAPEAVGHYSRGCILGAEALEPDGPTWQAMRLSRGRRWGHPTTMAFVRELAAAAPSLGLDGLLIGDIGQPRGGPMPYGHTSHQTGLDVDVWFRPMPAGRLAEATREGLPFVSMIVGDGAEGGPVATSDRSGGAIEGVDPKRFAPFARLMRQAASDERVARIFVHPTIKRALCDWDEAEAGGGRSWLRRIRPWYGHDAHFHVRLACPSGSPQCRDQAPPPAGEGCGAQLDYWFTAAPYVADPKAVPKPPLTLARMPSACRSLVRNR